MRKIIWILLLLSFNLKSQECSPFYKIPSYELSPNKSAAIGYVACLHARGIVAEVGYSNIYIGLLAMGENHNSDTYTFLQYDYPLKNLRFYEGPAYRIYKRILGTASILQINPQLNYLHTGFKLIL